MGVFGSRASFMVKLEELLGTMAEKSHPLVSSDFHPRFLISILHVPTSTLVASLLAGWIIDS